MRNSKHLPGKFFTLVELLVVIVVIMILAGILMPALNQARARAVAIQCSGNQRQLGQGCMLYATDYQYFPAAWPKTGEDWNQNLWYWKIMPYLGMTKIPKSFEDASEFRNSGPFECAAGGEISTLDDYYFSMNNGGMMLFGEKTPKLSHCAPSAGVPADNTSDTKSYHMSPESRSTNPSYMIPVSNILFISELGYNSGSRKRNPHIQNGYWFNDTTGIDVTQVRASWRHSGRKNVLWLDLHVSDVGKYEINPFLYLAPHTYKK